MSAVMFVRPVTPTYGLIFIRIRTSKVLRAVRNRPSGPGVKMFPTLLPSGTTAYIRKDAKAPGIFYADGGPGPSGRVRSPSWSPDGKRVVYHKIISTEARDWQPTWSRDPDYELIFTRWLPSFDRSGERLARVAMRRLLFLAILGRDAIRTWPGSDGGFSCA